MSNFGRYFLSIRCLIFGGLLIVATPALGQNPSAIGQPPDQKVMPLPAAKHGQPVFSFSGGQRVSVQKTSAPGLHDYSAKGQSSGGTGIVEVGAAGSANNSGVNEIVPGSTSGKNTGITELGRGSGYSNIITPMSKLAAPNALTGGTGSTSGISNSVSNSVKSGALKNRSKPATTRVQTLGPDGKMQYDEVRFVGELESNKRAPNITDVKDGEGKVKEYGWKKNH